MSSPSEPEKPDGASGSEKGGSYASAWWQYRIRCAAPWVWFAFFFAVGWVLPPEAKRTDLAIIVVGVFMLVFLLLRRWAGKFRCPRCGESFSGGLSVPSGRIAPFGYPQKCAKCSLPKGATSPNRSVRS